MRFNRAEIIDFEFYKRFGMILFTHYSLYNQALKNIGNVQLYIVRNECKSA